MPTDALLAQSIDALVNGVSQQPATQRLESQCEEQVNCTSDVAKGVKRRVPFEHVAPNATHNDLIAGLGAKPTDGYFIHIIDFGPTLQYVVFIEDGDVNVYDLSNGNEIVVNDVGAGGAAGSYTYLDTTAGGDTAQDTFAVVTIGDTTFISNKHIIPIVDAGVSVVERRNEFLLHCKPPTSSSKTGNEVYLRLGALADVFGTTTSAGDQNTEATIDDLMTALTGVVGTVGTQTVGSGVYTDWDFTRVSNATIHGIQTRNVANASHDQASAWDNFGDSQHEIMATTVSAATVIADASIQAFADLPAKAVDGFQVKVSGDNGKDEDDYYVQYDETENVWKETVGTQLEDVSTIDPDFMPHILLYQRSDDTFDFGPAAAASGPFPDGGLVSDFAWDDRLKGDVNSAPLPSFVGNPIRDIAVNKNRLTFISDDNVIASETGQFFNFWPTTVTEVLDSDPFDIAATGNEVSILDYAIPFANGISLFSSIGDTIQELVGSRDEQLTLKNARVEKRADVALSKVKPVLAGDSLYFALDKGDRTAVYQYNQQDIGVFKSVEVTSHCPTYLPANIYLMAAGKGESMIACLSSASGEEGNIYVYRFWVEGKDLIMSSWSRFEIDTTHSTTEILGLGWIDSTLHVFIQRQDSMHIEKLDFGKSVEHATNFPHRCHLDHQLALTGVYDSDDDETTWTLPYDQVTNHGSSNVQVVTGPDFGTAGDERGEVIGIDVAGMADLTITAEGDWSTGDCFIGVPYESLYEMSEIVFRSNDKSGETARLSGRLQLKRARVVYDDTGVFDVEVDSRDQDDGDTYTYPFTSEFINQALIGPRDITDGTFEFDIAGHSKDVKVTFKSSAVVPFVLSSFEWEGRFYQRSTQG
ncbi:MAG: hypothetical protein V3S01_06995 [Dehalococcoidia bacterium]